MPIEVIMPKVDMDMASGKITSWHIAVGDRVEKGDPLFDIETDKAAMEVEATDSGFLHHTAPEGSSVLIGQPVAWLYVEGEEVGESPTPITAKKPTPAAKPEQPSKTTQAPIETADTAPITGEKTRATPLARSLAKKSGISIKTMHGTGPRGRVQASDVRDAVSTPQQNRSATPITFTVENGPLAISRNKSETGTPIVLIHGFASDGKSWAPLEKQLAEKPIIRIELPSHGKSPNLRITQFLDLVNVVRQAFDDLNLEAAHLVGHSLGGAIALAIADTRSRSVASLSLIAPAGLGPDINGATLTGLTNATRASSLMPWLKTLVADERTISDGYANAAMATRSDANMRAAQIALAEVLFPDGTQSFDLKAALDRVDIPTRIFWGKQDHIIPWRHALRAPGRVGLHLFDNVGHLPQYETAQDIGKVMRSYVC